MSGEVLFFVYFLVLSISAILLPLSELVKALNGWEGFFRMLWEIALGGILFWSLLNWPFS